MRPTSKRFASHHFYEGAPQKVPVISRASSPATCTRITGYSETARLLPRGFFNRAGGDNCLIRWIPCARSRQGSRGTRRKPIGNHCVRGAVRIDVIGYQRFRPEGYPHVLHLARREKLLKLAGGKQSEFLHRAFGDMRAQQPVVFALHGSRHELNERQMVMALQGIPVVGRGYEPALADAHDLPRELLLASVAQDVLDDGVREDEVEALVGKRERAAVEDHVTGLRIVLPRAGHFTQLVASAHDTLGVLVHILKGVLREDVARGAHVEHAIFEPRLENCVEQLELPRPRLVAEVPQQPLEVGIHRPSGYYTAETPSEIELVLGPARAAWRTTRIWKVSMERTQLNCFRINKVHL